MARLCRVPIGQTSLDDLTWARPALGAPALSDADRAWLAFGLALMRWHQRHDIGVAEPPAQSAAGERDIQIEP